MPFQIKNNMRLLPETRTSLTICPRCGDASDGKYGSFISDNLPLVPSDHISKLSCKTKKEKKVKFCRCVGAQDHFQSRMSRSFGAIRCMCVFLLSMSPKSALRLFSFLQISFVCVIYPSICSKSLKATAVEEFD